MSRTPISAYATENARARWRPALLIQLSAWWHAACLLVLAVRPAWWPWLLVALAANHALISLAVLWPRGRWLGPNLTRLPAAAVTRSEISLTFDDGPDPMITPQVLALLERFGARASFFLIGEKAAAFPDIVSAIVRAGHSVENHTYRHPHAFAFFSVAALRREIEAAQTVIAGIAGRAPLFFRAPAGFRSPLLDYVLARMGMRYASWTRRGYDAVRRDPAQILRALTRGLAAGDVLVLHDGTRTITHEGVPVVLAVLPALLEELAARGLKSVPLPAACDDRSPAAQVAAVA
ncbi:MAG: GlcNAc deacetylase, Carbohydrate Esterase Family 4-like protein [Betaproteobacteria bacterium]|nr:GlcNAc deacetylase, Carbohydrate Esterase Family 4-like protein [Betaproteobacteria bacterium]